MLAADGGPPYWNLFLLLIDINTPLIIGILAFIDMITFMLSWDEHEKVHNLKLWLLVTRNKMVK